MGMNSIEELIDSLAPEEAMGALARATKKLFSYAGEKARSDFVYSLIGGADQSPLPGLVHRWLATCMDEGVDQGLTAGRVANWGKEDRKR